MGRVFFFACILSLPSIFLKAQDHFYATRNYTVKNGLPQSQVTSLLEDKNGYLWIGTQGGGLARFDGREFKVYTTLDGLLNNQIVDIRLDRNGNMLILHNRGITKFNGRDFKKIEAPGECPGVDQADVAHVRTGGYALYFFSPEQVHKNIPGLYLLLGEDNDR